MATFKLGAIITHIAGSIGGTTFKRGQSGLTVMNKSRGMTKNSLLQNKQLNAIGNVMRGWSKLSAGERQTWTTASAIYQFPDKFGVLKYLTPRQLFIKQNIQLLPVGTYVNDASSLDSHVPDLTLVSFIMHAVSNSIVISYNSNASSASILIQLEFSPKPLFSPNFSKRKIDYFSIISGSGTVDLLSVITTLYPNFNVSTSIRAYVTLMNTSGFKGVTQYIDVVWEDT